jgi:hypothetical protein
VKRTCAVASGALVVLLVAVGCSGSSDEGDPQAFCGQLASMGNLGQTVTGDPDDLRSAAAQMQDLAEVAPPEVRSSVEVVVAALETMASAAESSGPAGGAGEDDDAALEAAVRALQPDLELIEQASADIEVYATITCGEAPGVTTTSPTTPTGSARGLPTATYDGQM